MTPTEKDTTTAQRLAFVAAERCDVNSGSVAMRWMAEDIALALATAREAGEAAGYLRGLEWAAGLAIEVMKLADDTSNTRAADGAFVVSQKIRAEIERARRTT